MKDLLFEIGTEELPPLLLQTFSQDLATQLQLALDQAKLGYGAVQNYGSPRRLAVVVEDLMPQQPSITVTHKGPALAHAFDQGKPTPACLGFARRFGISVSDLTQQHTPKGVWLYYHETTEGQQTVDLLPELIASALKHLPIQRPMRWGVHTQAFIRPIHWMLLMYGTAVIRCRVWGNPTHDHTYGHRIHHPQALPIDCPKTYVAQLADPGRVMVDAQERTRYIVTHAHRLSEPHGRPLIESCLLEQIVGLVEYPVPLLAQFDAQFLRLPKAILIAVMSTHQKCFPIQNTQGALVPYFIIISNLHSTDPKQVIRGNERVMHARLQDAAFFYASDRKVSLMHWLSGLHQVVFHEQLGSLHSRSNRLSRLTGWVAQQQSLDVQQATRAGLLSKVDLLSHVVEEFDDLAGTMGAHYAQLSGEHPVVVQAIASHCLPRFSGDSLPSNACGQALAIADRMDLLVGFFGIGHMPSGEKDPFGLRRAAQGLVRLLIEYPVDLTALMHESIACYQASGIFFDQPHHCQHLTDFIMDRLRSWSLDRGISPHVFAAVSAKGQRDLRDIHQRLQALQAFQSSHQAQRLSAAHKRVHQFIKKHPLELPTITPQYFEDPVESALFEAINTTQKALSTTQDYATMLQVLSELQPPIDAFFDGVLVLSERLELRHNRLSLLHRLNALLLGVADLAQLP